MASILDENGDLIDDVEIQQRGPCEVAVVGAGTGHERILLPGAFTILSPESDALVRRAEDRAKHPWLR